MVDRSPNGRGSLLELQQQQPLEQLKENCSLTGLASSLDNLIEAARQQPPSDPTLSNSTTASSSAASTPDADGGGGRSGLSILQRAAELTTCAPLFAADSPQSPASTSQSSRSTTATPHEPVWRRAHSVDNDSAGGAVASRRRGRPMKRKVGAGRMTDDAGDTTNLERSRDARRLQWLCDDRLWLHSARTANVGMQVQKRIDSSHKGLK